MNTVLDAVPIYMWGIIVMILGVIAYFKEIKGSNAYNRHLQVGVLIIFGGLFGPFLLFESLLPPRMATIIFFIILSIFVVFFIYGITFRIRYFFKNR